MSIRIPSSGCLSFPVVERPWSTSILLELRGKSLLIIHKGEVHQITNKARRPLVTLNFYAPPAYTKGGEPRE